VRVAVPEGLVRIGEKMFYGCDNLVAVYVPSSVSIIAADVTADSPFYRCSEGLKIYCNVNAAQEGWGTYWNYYGSTKILDVEYEVTYAEFETKL